MSALSATASLTRSKSVNDPRGRRTLTDIGKDAESRGPGYPLPPRVLNTQHQPPVSYHVNVPHSHHEPNPSAYNQMTIAPTTAFDLPSLSNTSSSTTLQLPPPPFPPHLALQRPSPQHPPHFQSDSDHRSLPSLGQRLPPHFAQHSPLQPMSNSHSSAGSFTSPSFAPSHSAQVYQDAQPDTRNQPTSSAGGINTSFPSDEYHRDVSIDIDMSGSHTSFNHDGGDPGEGGVWNPDGRVRPLSPRDDVSQGGGASYDPQGGQVGGGVRFDNYRPERHQLSDPPLQDATEAIAKAMAAQRGDYVGGYKMPPLLPTFNLSNLNLQPRQEETGMTAGSRENLAASVSCAAPPVHTRTQWPQLSLQSPHSPGAGSGTGAAVNAFVSPRPFLEGRAAREAEMKRTMRSCLPRKEVCDHLVEYYVGPLRSSSVSCTIN